MGSYQVFSFLLLSGIIGCSLAHPQGGYNYPRPQQSYQPQQPELQGQAASFGQGSFASQQQQTFGAFGGNGQQNPSPSGGNLQTECKRQETSPGRYKFVCDGVNPNSIALRSEHILWLTGPAGQKHIVDIEVPNYKIEELIKAGFKNTPGGGTNINVLLRRPEQSYDAQVDTIPPAGGTPSVNLQYEPVQKTLVHFPNDKPYSPLQGPILPPFNGGGGNRQQF